MARDLSGSVYRQFKADLMNEAFPFDGLITEQMIADRYGVSKTPAREAATRLLYEGYLIKYPSKGYVMRNPSDKEIEDLTEYRYMLECAIAEKLIRVAGDEEIKNLLFLNADGEKKAPQPDEVLSFHMSNLDFHLAMARLAGNEYLVDSLQSTLYLLVRPSGVMRRKNYENYAQSQREINTSEHISIVHALLDRNFEAVKQFLYQDIFPRE